MTNKPENLLDSLKEVKLTDAERATGRNHLMSLMAATPVAPTPAPVPNYFWPIVGIISGGFVTISLLLVTNVLTLPEFPQEIVKNAEELENQLVDTKTGEELVEEEVLTTVPAVPSEPTASTADVEETVVAEDPVEEETAEEEDCVFNGTDCIPVEEDCVITSTGDCAPTDTTLDTLDSTIDTSTSTGTKPLPRFQERF